MRAHDVSRGATRCSSLAVAIAAILALGACGGAPERRTPAAPASVTATALAGGVRVSWTAGGGGATAFVLYRRAVTPGDPAAEPAVAPAALGPGRGGAAAAARGAVPGQQQDGFARIGEAPADADHYDDLTTRAGEAYQYQVAATNAAGASGVTRQANAPVTPLPAVPLTLTLDGVGAITVDGGGTVRRCASGCTLPYAAGSRVTLRAAGAAGQVFAGWTGACEGAGPCTVTLAGPTAVGAAFATTVLTLTLRGDTPVTATIAPGTGGFGVATCALEPGEACAVRYPQDGLTVSVSLDMQTAGDGAVAAPFEGCDTQSNGTFCLVALPGGASHVAASVLHPPVAAAEAFEGREDRTLTVEAPGVLANDHDAPGDTLTAVLDSPPTHGTLVLEADGAFRYQPDPDANGPDAFTYHARDAYGNASGSVTTAIDVGAVNDAPEFDLDADPPEVRDGQGAQVVPGFATGIGPGGGPDETGQALRFALAVAPGGSLRFAAAPVLEPDGTLRYTPTTGTFGTAAVTATLRDDGGTAHGGEDAFARTFPIRVRPLALHATTAGGGTLELDPPPVAGGYAYGSTVTVTARAGLGERLTAWGGACSAVPASEATCRLRLTADTTVTATFVPLHTLTVRIDANVPWYGSVRSEPEGIDCGDSCTADYPAGTTVTLTPHALPYFTAFTGWSGACSGTGACTLRMDAARTVTARFARVDGDR